MGTALALRSMLALDDGPSGGEGPPSPRSPPADAAATVAAAATAVVGEVAAVSGTAARTLPSPRAPACAGTRVAGVGTPQPCRHGGRAWRVTGSSTRVPERVGMALPSRHASSVRRHAAMPTRQEGVPTRLLRAGTPTCVPTRCRTPTHASSVSARWRVLTRWLTEQRDTRRGGEQGRGRGRGDGARPKGNCCTGGYFC